MSDEIKKGDVESRDNTKDDHNKFMASEDELNDETVDVELTEEEHKKLMAELNDAVEDYNKAIPKEETELYHIYEEIFKLQVLFSKKFGIYVKKMYRRFNTMYNDSILAGNLTKRALMKYRSVPTIRKYLPYEAKDPVRVAAAGVSNAEQSVTRKANESRTKVRDPITTGVKTKETEVEIEDEPVKKEKQPIKVLVREGIYTRMIEMCIKSKEAFWLTVDPVSKTLIDVESSEEGQPEPAAPRPR